MDVGKNNAGEVWYDITGNQTNTVTINKDGWGQFQVSGDQFPYMFSSNLVMK